MGSEGGPTPSGEGAWWTEKTKRPVPVREVGGVTNVSAGGAPSGLYLRHGLCSSNPTHAAVAVTVARYHPENDNASSSAEESPVGVWYSVMGEPILCKGDDFTHTDLSPTIT